MAKVTSSMGFISANGNINTNRDLVKDRIKFSFIRCMNGTRHHFNKSGLICILWPHMTNPLTGRNGFILLTEVHCSVCFFLDGG